MSTEKADKGPAFKATVKNVSKRELQPPSSQNRAEGQILVDLGYLRLIESICTSGGLGCNPKSGYFDPEMDEKGRQKAIFEKSWPGWRFMC